METFTKVYDLYAYDNLRADGFSVRFARLNMISTDINVVWLLCWAMEIIFALSFVSDNKQARVAYLAAFWLAWLNIIQIVY